MSAIWTKKYYSGTILLHRENIGVKALETLALLQVYLCFQDYLEHSLENLKQI